MRQNQGDGTMGHPGPEGITGLLQAWGRGDREALDRLMPEVQSELRRLAAGYLRRERAGHTLQTTALVNEAYLRIIDQERVRWHDRAHFFAISARIMRRILVDHTRRRQAAKRGALATQLTFDEDRDSPQLAKVDVIDLDTALDRLAEFDERQSRVVELRFFAGLTVEEIGLVLEISPATVKREWALARAWLYRQLHGALHEP